MMKNKAILTSLYSLGFILFALVTVAITYGWLSKEITLTSNTIQIGEILYEKSGSWIAADTPIVPGTDLIADDIVLTNNSSITTQMRMTIVYTKYEYVSEVLTASDVTYSGTGDHIIVTMNENFAYSNSFWNYTSSEYSIPANSGAMTIISSLYYDGGIVSIDYSSKPVSVTITIQVKQTDNVTWNDLATYVFEID